MLEYKANLYGKTVVVVDRWYPSSQLCSKCGARHKHKLNERTYVCKTCGHKLCRDLNASYNIDTFSIGEEILLDSIRAPFNTILDNAGIEEVSHKIVSGIGYGLNVVTGNTVNMIEAGIIDPLLVTKSALRNAASVATTILSTDCVINNLRA
jgi:hypothetical protein